VFLIPLADPARGTFKLALQPEIPLALPTDGRIASEKDGVHAELVDLFDELGGDVAFPVDVELEEEGLAGCAGGLELV
jgi:hypothetical protein